MVVQALGHELKGQRVLLAAGLFDFGPLVLEPDLYLSFVQAEVTRQFSSSLLAQVPIFREFPLEPRQLFAAEGRPRAFFFRRARGGSPFVRALHSPRSWTWNREIF